MHESENNKKVSVIIPCYNLGKYIQETIDSVFGQTYKEIEIIVVDDGSTDSETIEVLKNLDSRVKVFFEKNFGVGSARNKGFRQSTGRFVLFLDADDLIEKTYLAKAVKILENNPKVGFVTPWIRAFGVDNWELVRPKYNFIDSLVENLVCTAALLKRECFENVGGYNESREMMGIEDWDLWIRIGAAAWQGEVIKEPLFLYRQRENSLVRNSNELKKREELMKKLIENNHNLYAANFEEVLVKKDILFMKKIMEFSKLHIELQEQNKIINDKNNIISSRDSELHAIRSSLRWKISNWIYKKCTPLRICTRFFYKKFSILESKFERLILNVKQRISYICILFYSKFKYGIDFKEGKMLSVIMLTLNRFEDTNKAILNLFKYLPKNFELIILDNGSSDEKLLKFLKELEGTRSNVKVIFEKDNLGCAGGRKKAFSYAEGDYILSLDNDIFIMPNTVQNLLEQIEENKDIAGICCKVVFPNGRIQFNGGSQFVDGKFIKFNLLDCDKFFADKSSLQIHDCQWIPGGATLWRAEILKKFSIDSEMKGAYEDNEFSLQLKEAGYGLQNCFKALVIHNHIEFNRKAKEDQDYMKARYSDSRIKDAIIYFYKKHGYIIDDGYLNMFFPSMNKAEILANLNNE